MKYSITWIGQGGYIFVLGEKVLCIDPYLSDSVKKLSGFERLVPPPIAPEELKCDMIVATHDHIDHLDEETISNLKGWDMSFAGPTSCVEHFKRIGIPDRQIVTLNKGESIVLGSAVIYGVHAEHTGDSIGVVVEYDGCVIYVTGDSLYDEQLLDVRKYNPDIAIVCINGKLGNMGYEDAAALVRGLRVKVAIPSHYGMFAENTEDPANFHEALKGSSVRFHELEYNRKYTISDILG